MGRAIGVITCDASMNFREADIGERGAQWGAEARGVRWGGDWGVGGSGEENEEAERERDEVW